MSWIHCHNEPFILFAHSSHLVTDEWLRYINFLIKQLRLETFICQEVIIFYSQGETCCYAFAVQNFQFGEFFYILQFSLFVLMSSIAPLVFSLYFGGNLFIAIQLNAQLHQMSLDIKFWKSHLGFLHFSSFFYYSETPSLIEICVTEQNSFFFNTTYFNS